MTNVQITTRQSQFRLSGADAPTNLGRAAALVRGWAMTQDHRRIAQMNLAIIVVVAIISGLDAALYTGQRGHIVGAHGLVLAFWVLVPLIPATLGVYFLPQMIGAQRFAFPRMNTLCLYLFASSAMVGAVTLVAWPVDAGLAIDPLTSAAGTGGAGLGLIVALLVGVVAMILMNLNIVVTTQTCRANGVGWFDLPVFVWGLTSAALVGVLTLPLGLLALLLLLIDRQLQTGFFDPALGGVPGLYRHMFWFAAHPALYNALLPAVGIIAVVLRISPRHAPAAHQRIVLCIVAIAALNSITWGVELMTSIRPVTAVVFSSLAMLIVIPALIIAFDLLGALWNNGVRLTSPIIYALLFLFFVGNGVAAGLLLRPLSTGMQLYNTSFHSAHLHILLLGGVGTAFIAGLLDLWPQIVGRAYSVAWTGVAAALIFEGVNLAFFPQFVIGLNGAVHHIAGMTPMYEQLQRISASGAWLLSLGVVIQIVVLAHSGLLSPPPPSNDPPRPHGAH